MLSYFGKTLIFLGFLLVLIGIIFLFGSPAQISQKFEAGKKIPFFGKLPGDIYIKKGNFTFFAPISTFLLISIIFSIIFYIISRFLK